MVGGNHVANDVNRLREGVHVVIGTPGRILHLLRKGYLGKFELMTSNLIYVVIKIYIYIKCIQYH